MFDVAYTWQDLPSLEKSLKGQSVLLQAIRLNAYILIINAFPSKLISTFWMFHSLSKFFPFSSLFYSQIHPQANKARLQDNCYIILMYTNESHNREFKKFCFSNIPGSHDKRGGPALFIDVSKPDWCNLEDEYNSVELARLFMYLQGIPK